MAGLVFRGCPGTTLPGYGRAVAPAIVWDRDETLNYDPGYISSWSDFQWRRGALDALAKAERMGFRNLVATNQSGIEKGMLTEAELVEISERMMADAPIVAISYCVHEEGQGCPARKPMPGMVEALDAVVGIDRPQSAMIGDRLTDVECGEAAGLVSCRCEPGESLVEALNRALSQIGTF